MTTGYVLTGPVSDGAAPQPSSTDRQEPQTSKAVLQGTKLARRIKRDRPRSMSQADQTQWSSMGASPHTPILLEALTV
jgi:hypothetical protein